MSDLSTGRLIPVNPEKAKLSYDAFKALSASPAFREVVDLIEQRLVLVDSANRQRGQENQYTEAQAWSWFLSAVKNSASVGEVKTMELQQ
jgi:hypothetical protein